MEVLAPSSSLFYPYPELIDRLSCSRLRALLFIYILTLILMSNGGSRDGKFCSAAPTDLIDWDIIHTNVSPANDTFIENINSTELLSNVLMESSNVSLADVHSWMPQKRSLGDLKKSFCRSIQSISEFQAVQWIAARKEIAEFERDFPRAGSTAVENAGLPAFGATAPKGVALPVRRRIGGQQALLQFYEQPYYVLTFPPRVDEHGLLFPDRASDLFWDFAERSRHNNCKNKTNVYYVAGVAPTSRVAFPGSLPKLGPGKTADNSSFGRSQLSSSSVTTGAAGPPAGAAAGAAAVNNSGRSLLAEGGYNPLKPHPDSAEVKPNPRVTAGDQVRSSVDEFVMRHQQHDSDPRIHNGENSAVMIKHEEHEQLRTVRVHPNRNEDKYSNRPAPQRYHGNDIRPEMVEHVAYQQQHQQTSKGEANAADKTKTPQQTHKRPPAKSAPVALFKANVKPNRTTKAAKPRPAPRKRVMRRIPPRDYSVKNFFACMDGNNLQTTSIRTVGNSTRAPIRNSSALPIYSLAGGSTPSSSGSRSDTQAPQFSSLAFFTIYKAGNTYIRSLLEHALLENKAGYSTDVMIKALFKNTMPSAGTVTSYKSPRATKVPRPSMSTKNGYFSFAFVRDPIQRFISGYTEIEHRIVNAPPVPVMCGEGPPSLFDAHGVSTKNATTESLYPNKDGKSNSTANRRSGFGNITENQIASRTGTQTSNRSSSTIPSAEKILVGTPLYREGHTHFWRDYPLGSVARFEAYIIWLLKFAASNKIISSCPVNDHIAPQVGTLVAAAHLQSSPRMFHLERFDEEWSALVREASLSPSVLSAKASFSRQRDYHKSRQSSLDVYNTSHMASAYLFAPPHHSPARDAVERKRPQQPEVRTLGFLRGFSADKKSKTAAAPTVKAPTTATTAATTTNGGASSSDAHFQTSPQFTRNERFLRALCRIYASDFVCLGYEFPSVCQDIQKDFDDFIL